MALVLACAACSDSNANTTDSAGHPLVGDGSAGRADARATLAVEPPRPVLDHSAWQKYPRSGDPLPSHEPSEISCSVAGYRIEGASLEVSTQECNYLLLEHPALVDIAEGDELEVLFRHYDLLADSPSEAHVALLLDGAVGWEKHIPIPSSLDVIKERFSAPRALKAGEPVLLHLHNHGQNTYTLVSLTLVAQAK